MAKYFLQLQPHPNICMVATASFLILVASGVTTGFVVAIHSRGVPGTSDVDAFDVDGDVDIDLNSSSRTTPRPTPPGLRTNIPMSAALRPQYVFSLHSNSTVFSFEILKEFREREEIAENVHSSKKATGVTSPSYRLSVVLERIACYGSDNHLVLEGQGTHGEVTRSIKLCMIEDNEVNQWQTVDNFLDDVTLAEVKVEGDWAASGLSAQLVVSIYHEVDGGCEACSPGEFCCGLSYSRTGDYDFFRAHPLRVRCIPGSGFCNRHPNCGMYSNLDESQATCSPRDCVGSECQWAQLALRILVLGVFCFLVPPTILVFICRLKACRRIRHGWNEVVDQYCGRGRRSRSPSPDGSEGDPRPSFCTRHGHHEETATSSYNPEEDQPPSYEDFLRSHKTLSVIQLKENVEHGDPEPPPPTFDQAVSSGSSGGSCSGQNQGQSQHRGQGQGQGGTVNPAFVLHDEEVE